jgi:hypothetical protein
MEFGPRSLRMPSKVPSWLSVPALAPNRPTLVEPNTKDLAARWPATVS